MTDAFAAAQIGGDSHVIGLPSDRVNELITGQRGEMKLLYHTLNLIFHDNKMPSVCSNVVIADVSSICEHFSILNAMDGTSLLGMQFVSRVRTSVVQIKQRGYE